jgi:hypothetical protein
VGSNGNSIYSAGECGVPAAPKPLPVRRCSVNATTRQLQMSESACFNLALDEGNIVCAGDITFGMARSSPDRVSSTAVALTPALAFLHFVPSSPTAWYPAANLDCAICNGFSKDLASQGRCDSVPTNIVSSCADGSTDRCRWFAADPVCGISSDDQPTTYLNPSWYGSPTALGFSPRLGPLAPAPLVPSRSGGLDAWKGFALTSDRVRQRGLQQR